MLIPFQLLFSRACHNIRKFKKFNYKNLGARPIKKTNLRLDNVTPSYDNRLEIGIIYI